MRYAYTAVPGHEAETAGVSPAERLRVQSFRTPEGERV